MTAPIVLYGIPNCDTVKKARAWLTANGIDHVLHDYKKSGVDAAQLARWCSVAGWDAVLNRSGTTFRKLSDAEKADLTGDKAIALMIAQPSMIKRPIMERGEALLIGFKPEDYAAAFG